MSIYEMMDYDELLRRIGIQPHETWHCGDNPAAEVVLDEPGITFDDPGIAYAGRNPKLVGGFCLSEDINVNGLLLNHRDANNTLWLCTGIEGWWTLPPSEIPDVPKPYWDGSLLTTGRYQSRTITISGLFIPPHPSLVWYNRDAILRACGIVRGVGLLAMCGNETPDLNEFTAQGDPFYDPPKMAIIQANDVPLIETTKTSGFTQFSLSFRSVNPAKISVYEQNASLPVEAVGEVTRQRRYRAISLAADEGGGATTEYAELRYTTDPAGDRRYPDVLGVNIDTLIEDEEYVSAGGFPNSSYITTDSNSTVTLHNAGNYFAFPTFVFGEIKPKAGKTTVEVIVRNLTTGESMTIRKPVAEGHQLVVDSGMRRVGEVDAETSALSWKFDDRNYLTMTSEWITLAPGPNTVIVSRSPDTVISAQPTCYWRDTWIG